MRNGYTVVKQYQQAHRRWSRLKRKGVSADSWQLAEARGAVHALAWVLGVDPLGAANGSPKGRYRPAEMTSPDGRPPLSGVRLTRAWQDDHGCWWWLLEVPATPDDETDYWADFLPQQCVAELALAMGSAYFTSTAESFGKLIEACPQADQPTVTDVRALIEQTAEWPVRDRRTGGAA